MRSFTNLLIVFALLASANLIKLSSRKQQQQKYQQPQQEVVISKSFDLKDNSVQPSVVISKVSLDQDGNEISEEIQPQQSQSESQPQQPMEVEPKVQDDVDEEAKTA